MNAGQSATEGDLFLDEADSDAPDGSALGTERSAIRCAGLDPRVVPAVIEANRRETLSPVYSLVLLC